MDIFFQIIVLLFSVVIHEISHGYVAYALGDPTAEKMGRLTLNPLPHLDLFGSIIIPGLLIITGSSFVLGWAKPVPYNPALLKKDLKYGPLKVALAGPASNLGLALVFGAVLRLGHGALPSAALSMFGFIVFLNILLAVFNLVPVPPLDGSKILTIILPYPYSQYVQRIGIGGIFFVIIFLVLFGGVIFSVTAFLSQLIMGDPAWNTFMGMLGG